MGYASYLEDIFERATRELAHVSSSIEASVATEPRERQQLLKLADECRRILHELLDKLTDPKLSDPLEALENIDRLEVQSERVTQLEQDNSALRGKIAELEAAVQHLRESDRTSRDSHKVALDSLRDTTREREKEIESLRAQNATQAKHLSTANEYVEKMKRHSNRVDNQKAKEPAETESSEWEKATRGVSPVRNRRDPDNGGG